MENTETVKITKIANGYQLTVQHDQSGSAYGCDLSEAAYQQLRLHFVSIALSGFMDWLWLNHNILTNADNNKIALEKYLATL